jgi:hypothetical protein
MALPFFVISSGEQVRPETFVPDLRKAGGRSKAFIPHPEVGHADLIRLVE